MALLQGGAGAFLVPIGRLSFLMGRYGQKTSLRNARVLVRARSVRDSACLLACSAYHTALASRSIARTRTGSGHIPSSASGHAGRLLFRYTSRARQPPVAVLFIHDLWAVAPHGSYIHRGSCPRAWAVSQQQIFELQQAYEGAAIFAITWHVSEFENFAVAELPAQIFSHTLSQSKTC